MTHNIYIVDVAANQSINKMTEKNLAIVISPNLYFAGDSVAPMEVCYLFIYSSFYEYVK